MRRMAGAAGSAAHASLTDTLCTRCGLCCDGSLFADVELAGRDEASSLELLGLEIEDGDGEHRGLLIQPCRALKGTRCSVYAHRPDCCRTFECKLLQETRLGLVSVAAAREMVADALERRARIHDLIAALGQDDEGLPLEERCVETLAARDSDPKRLALRGELKRALRAFENLIETTFLGRSDAAD
jgi:Fe-S-cluster containining protein